MLAVILLLHVAGITLLLTGGVASHGAGVLGIGLGVTAYTLGMRHAFDADHIAAIDNTTRKLMNEGQRPVSVGFWFSLGHSSVVFALTLLLAAGVRALAGPLRDDGSVLHTVTGLIGTTVSGVFLYVIAAVNIAFLVATVKLLRRTRSGDVDASELDEHLSNQGVLIRLFRPLTRAVRRPWQMYPVGVLFGFGFDTATEIGLLVLAATTAAAGVPWWALLSLPLLFTAGMSLLDTADGAFMRAAYGWAFASPERKLHYNLWVTVLSVTVAVLVGSAELVSLAANRLHLVGGLWNWVEHLNLNLIGFGVVGVFVLVWGAAITTWRFRHRPTATHATP
jgi:high-affinity nickel-transport protein